MDSEDKIVDFNTIVRKGINYYRYNLQEIMHYDKPMVVVGTCCGEACNSDSKIVFQNIIPYVNDSYDVRNVTSHINIPKSELREYMDSFENLYGKKYVMVVRVYSYNDQYDIPRFGLKLSDELEYFGFPKIIELKDSNPVTDIPENLTLNFINTFKNYYVCDKIDNTNNISYKPNLDNIVNIYSIKENRNKKTRKGSYFKKTNIKTAMRTSSKRRLYDMKHSFDNNIAYDYSVFMNT